MLDRDRRRPSQALGAKGQPSPELSADMSIPGAWEHRIIIFMDFFPITFEGGDRKTR